MSLLAISPDSTQWKCSLLQVDGVYILLDAGLPSLYEGDPKLLYQQLLPYIKSNEISFILISHPDVQHCGALPWLISKAGLQAPIVCTDPVRHLGELSCIGMVEELAKYTPYDVMETEDVVAAFLENSNWQTLRYGERFLFRSNVGGIGGQFSSTAVDYDANMDDDENLEILDEGAGYGSGANARCREVGIQAYPSGGTLGGSYYFLYFGLQKVVYYYTSVDNAQ